jgi:two-component sensor histidine kinase
MATGAPFALIVLKDGDVAASVGAKPAGANAAELAGFGLARVVSPATTPPAAEGRSAWVIRDAAGKALGALVAACSRPGPARTAAGEVMEDIAVVAGEELTRDAAALALTEERETLFAEVDHRVKNVIAVVQSIASQSARRAVSLEGFMKAFTGRLKAMGSAQELLTAARWRGAAIHNLAAAELSALAPGRIRWEGPDLTLTPRAASALTMALHELAANAVKHGALSTDAGEVLLSWRRAEDGRLELDWAETGGPPISPPSHRGFGLTLLEDITPRELGGEARVRFPSGGIRVTMTGAPDVLMAEGPAPLTSAPARAPAGVRTAGASIGPASLAHAAKVKGLRVFIVEDALLLAMELKAGLTEAGADVVGLAGDIDEAMALADLPMDAAVLDVQLKGESVEPVARALAARGVPFLFATGYSERRGPPQGFDVPIVHKPYEVAQIAAALAELTGRA